MARGSGRFQRSRISRHGELHGQAAIPHYAGKSGGAAWYLSIVPENNGWCALFRKVLDAAGLPSHTAPDSVFEIAIQSNDATDFTFALNHSAELISVTAPAESVDLLGAMVTDMSFIPPRSCVAVISAPRTGTVPVLNKTSQIPRTTGEGKHVVCPPFGVG